MNDNAVRIIGALISGFALVYMTCGGGAFDETIFAFWALILFLSLFA